MKKCGREVGCHWVQMGEGEKQLFFEWFLKYVRKSGLPDTFSKNPRNTKFHNLNIPGLRNQWPSLPLFLNLIYWLNCSDKSFELPYKSLIRESVMSDKTVDIPFLIKKGLNPQINLCVYHWPDDYDFLLYSEGNNLFFLYWCRHQV